MIGRDAIRHVLVRATNWVGDVILMTPALTAVRRAFPLASITALARSPVAELLTASPDVNEVMRDETHDRDGGLAGRLALIREVRRQGFDLAIVFPHAFEAALVAALAGIPIRVGYRAEGRGWLLTHPVKRRPSRRHQLHHYLDLVEAFGIKPDHAGPVLRLSLESIAEADRLLGQAGVRPGAVLIGLNPGAAYGPAKRWPAEQYAALAARLEARCGAIPIILGGPADLEAAEEVMARYEAHHRGRLISVAGQTSLLGAAAVIARCRVVVTNDSGLMHVAAALGVPVVALFGPTDPVLTGPVGNGHTVLRRPVPCSPCRFRDCPIDHRCLAWITVEEAYAAVARSLAGGE